MRGHTTFAMSFVGMYAALIVACCIWAASPAQRRAFVCGALAAPPIWERCMGVKP